MAEVVFRLPSVVPYGYVEVRWESPGKPIAPEILASMYANYVLAFAEEERKAASAYGNPSTAAPAAVGAEVDQEDQAHETAVQAVAEGLGATVIEEGEAPAPWETKVPAPQAKPWEKKAAPAAKASEDVTAAAVSIDW